MAMGGAWKWWGKTTPFIDGDIVIIPTLARYIGKYNWKEDTLFPGNEIYNQINESVLIYQDNVIAIFYSSRTPSPHSVAMYDYNNDTIQLIPNAQISGTSTSPVLLPNRKVLFGDSYDTGREFLYNLDTNMVESISNPGVIFSGGYSYGIFIKSGKAILIPSIFYSFNTYEMSYLCSYDYITDTITRVRIAVPPIRPPSFCGGVLMPDDTITIIPDRSGNIVKYYPETNEYEVKAQINGDYRIGAILAKNGKIILLPNTASVSSAYPGCNYFGIYNPQNDTFEIGAALPQGSGVFTTGVMLPNGNILLIGATNTNNPHFIIYNPNNNSVSLGAGFENWPVTGTAGYFSKAFFIPFNA